MKNEIINNFDIDKNLDDHKLTYYENSSCKKGVYMKKYPHVTVDIYNIWEKYVYK